MEAAMKNGTIVFAMFLALLCGCAGRTELSSFSASAALAGQRDCERNRGLWHANLGICEVCP